MCMAGVVGVGIWMGSVCGEPRLVDAGCARADAAVGISQLGGIGVCSERGLGLAGGGQQAVGEVAGHVGRFVE